MSIANRAALSLLICSCTAASHIDACDRELPDIFTANASTDGDQQTGGPRSLVALPDGRALLAFFSEASSSDPAFDLRAARFDRSSDRVVACDDQRDHTLVDAAADHSATSLAAAAGPTLTESGVIAWTSDATPTTPSRLYVTAFNPANGCLYSEAQWSESFDEMGDARATPSPSIVRTEPNRWLVIWASTSSAPSGSIRAAAFGLSLDTMEPLPLVDRMGRVVTGAVTHHPADHFVSRARAIATRNGEVAVLVLSSDAGTITPQLSFFDAQMRPLRDGRLFTLGSSWERQAATTEIDLAFDGRQILAVWTKYDENGRRRAMGRLVTADGDSLRSALAPDGGELRIDPRDDGEETLPSILARPEGGFWITYGRVEPGSDGSLATIALLALAADGARQFLNPPCDRDVFAVSESPGSHNAPSIARLADGTIAVAWTALDSGGVDPIGHSILARFMPMRSLLPVP
jgi:hypothetical protein